MLRKRLCPDGSRAIFQSIATANDGSKLALLTSLGELVSSCNECVCYNCTPLNAQSVVVELKYREVMVARQEFDHGLSGTSTESIVRQVELDELGVINQCITERFESGWDLADEPSCKDVCKICDLEVGCRGR